MAPALKTARFTPNLAIVLIALNLNIAQFPPLANLSLSWQPPTFAPHQLLDHVKTVTFPIHLS